MDIVSKILVSHMFLVTCHTKDLKHATYMQGENATIYIDLLKGTGKRVLEITFTSYTSKPHAILVMLYDSMEKQADYSRKYAGRIKHIKMDNASFSFNLHYVNFVDSGNYTAFEDSLELGKASIIVPLNNERSSPESSHGYFNSSCITNPACSDAVNVVWARLLFATVGAAVTVPLTVAITLLIIWRRGSFQCNCMGPGKRPKEADVICSNQDLKIGPISKNTIKGADADESEYEEPHSNKTVLGIYLEPLDIETAHTEKDNPGGYGSKVYEKLHPYGNQGNNTYSSLGTEQNLEVSERPII